MTLDEILEEWEKDGPIDIVDLSIESTSKIPLLHHKYFKMFSYERTKLKKMESDLKKLRFDKFQFYTEGPDESTPKEWLSLYPARGKILKTEAGNYVDNDPDVIKLTLKVGLQGEKIALLESIIRMIMNRGFQIKNAIDWEKFKVGG